MSNAMTYDAVLETAKSSLAQYVLENHIDNVDTHWDAIADAINDIANEETPHYYQDVFSVLLSPNISFDMDDSGLIDGTKDVFRICQIRIYEQLVIDLQAAAAGIVHYTEWDDEE